MKPTNISEDDYFGRMFICLKGGPNNYNRYFEGISKLQSFLRSDDLKDYVTGFFLNVHDPQQLPPERDLRGIRFSYFTKNPDDAVPFLRKNFQKLGFKKYCEKGPQGDKTFECYYGPENRGELEFRRFLHMYTCIGLDLLKTNIAYARKLVAKYRLAIGQADVSCKSYFEPAFQEVDYYLNLSANLTKELWRAMNYWHKPGEPIGDWIHMLVNMLLPGEPSTILPIRSGRERTLFLDYLNRVNLDLPQEWSP